MKNYLSILFVVSKDHKPSNWLQKIKLKHLATSKSYSASKSLFWYVLLRKMWSSCDVTVMIKTWKHIAQDRKPEWKPSLDFNAVEDLAMAMGSVCNSCRIEQFTIHNSVRCDHNCDVIAQEVFRTTYPTLRGAKSSLTTGNQTKLYIMGMSKD